ncbi:protein GLUTAMINE DUMPER 6-like [Miscanthus floridulus]|uniref:protein GLUTAMINE DUMPER 6-like n=1 Tax=Miscanthus floridulus TaxID=154761 RepID=UPI0034584597
MRPERGGGISVKLMGGGGGGPPSLWKTPTPYVFLGIAFMMGVIAVALLVLICTRKKASSSSSDEKAAAAARALVPLDRVPKVVVFMPGDDRAPSFLASVKPLGGDGAAAVV